MVVLEVVGEYPGDVVPDGSDVPTDVVGETPLDPEEVLSVAPGVVGELPSYSEDVVPVPAPEVPGS